MGQTLIPYRNEAVKAAPEGADSSGETSITSKGVTFNKSSRQSASDDLRVGKKVTHPWEACASVSCPRKLIHGHNALNHCGLFILWEGAGSEDSIQNCERDNEKD